jgi:uncharacterized DUF497 family protein
MEFEWDEEKARRNLKKHRVSFDEASSVFGDTLSSTFHDPDHSVGEDRYNTIGRSDRGRIIIVSHTDRGGRIRIISSRLATRRERKAYEEEG